MSRDVAAVVLITVGTAAASSGVGLWLRSVGAGITMFGVIVLLLGLLLGTTPGDERMLEPE